MNAACACARMCMIWICMSAWVCVCMYELDVHVLACKILILM